MCDLDDRCETRGAHEKSVHDLFFLNFSVQPDYRRYFPAIRQENGGKPPDLASETLEILQSSKHSRKREHTRTEREGIRNGEEPKR